MCSIISTRVLLTYFWKSETLRNFIQTPQFVRDIGRLAGASIPPTAMTQPFPPRLPPLRSPPFSSPPLPSTFTGIRGYDPRFIPPEKFLELQMLAGEFWSILDIKINICMSQVFLTGSCKFRISSKCACSIVNR